MVHYMSAIRLGISEAQLYKGASTRLAEDLNRRGFEPSQKAASRQSILDQCGRSSEMLSSKISHS